jgi:hypothetical protein
MFGADVDADVLATSQDSEGSWSTRQPWGYRLLSTLPCVAQQHHSAVR